MDTPSEEAVRTCNCTTFNLHHGQHTKGMRICYSHVIVLLQYTDSRFTGLLGRASVISKAVGVVALRSDEYT